MRYIEVPGEIDANNRLILHESLREIKPQQVEIDIVFCDDNEEEYREPTKAEILADIVESLREYSSGECTPVSEMWNDIKIKTTGEINDKGQLVIDQPLKNTKPQSVDVVLWFIKDDKSQHEFDDFGEKIHEQHLTVVKELSESRR
jgi:hypothetical protein